MMIRCPGQDQRFWKPEDVFEVQCSKCSGSVEFFKDEPKLKCRSCGKIVRNPRIDLGCAEWCQYAEQCLDVQGADSTRAIVNRLIEEMKKLFGEDTKRIDHAMTVLDYAQQIQAVQGGDPFVVRAAAILHDIGIHEAERRYGSAAGKYQEMEGPGIARQILERFDIEEGAIKHICKIIANHHSARDIDTKEFRIVWDADRLVNIKIDFANVGKEKLRELIEKTFKTNKGRQIACEAIANSKY